MAETLGRTVAEIEDTMSYAEFTMWASFFEVREREREEARKKSSGGKRKG